jgi:hypothetical protein
MYIINQAKQTPLLRCRPRQTYENSFQNGTEK